MWRVLGVAVLGVLCAQLGCKPKVVNRADLVREGGTVLVYSLDLSRIPKEARAAAAQETKEIVTQRLRRYGLGRVGVQLTHQDRLEVCIPSADQDAISDIKPQIATTARLAFHLALEEDPPDTRLAEVTRKEEEFSKRLNAWAEGPASDAPKPPEAVARPQYRKDLSTGEAVVDPTTKLPVIDHWWILDNRAENTLSPRFITSAYPTIDPATQVPTVAFRLRPQDSQQFGELTKQNIGKRIAIVLDDVVLSVPVVKAAIYGSASITGGFTIKEARGLANVLSVRSLPARPTIVKEERIEPKH